MSCGLSSSPPAPKLTDRMAMLGVQCKERLRLYQEKIDIPMLLKMRRGE
jgi:hypothetical protein